LSDEPEETHEFWTCYHVSHPCSIQMEVVLLM
jgi:hypothetical protein